MAAATAIPATMKALWLTSTSEPLQVVTRPTPKAVPGSAVVKVLSAGLISYMGEIYCGKRPYPFPKPMIPGLSAVGRIVEVPRDATKLTPGDLVFVDCLVRSRDEPADAFLASIHHGHTPGSQKLMKDAVRDWTFAEYCLAPLENLIPLNERRLLGSVADGGLGYQINDVQYLATLLVPYGGLRDINLLPGETVIIAPATGQFGGAAVLAALGMGARVIAMGRNKQVLAALKTTVPHPERVEIVPITGDMEFDCAALKSFGTIDALFDISPDAASGSTHLKSAILALRHGARISLMGGYKSDVPIPHFWIMHFNMRIYGKWMYERQDIIDMVKLVERGNMVLGSAGGCRIAGAYPLEQFKSAFEAAAIHTAAGQHVVFEP